MALWLWVVGVLMAVEMGLRMARRVRHDRRFWDAGAAPAPRSLSFQSHPYALYVKKPHNRGLYPSNSLGYSGTREWSATRLPGSVRIYCVGGSTTEAHDPQQGPDASWPGKLEDRLRARFPGRGIECINAGTAGYTSAESLAEFLFRGVDLQPDILLVYHNVNDAWTCQMVDGFKSDYSHARRHKPWRVGWVNRLPQLPWCLTYQRLRAWIADRYGKANALIYWIADPPWTAARAVDPMAVAAFRRNIINLARVAQAWSCLPVLIQWECDWEARQLPEYLPRNAEMTQVYFDLLRANNHALEEIASQIEGCRCISVGPFDPHDFVDTIHFSPRGLDEMARRVAEKIEPLVASILEERPGNEDDRQGVAGRVSACARG